MNFLLLSSLFSLVLSNYSNFNIFIQDFPETLSNNSIITTKLSVESNNETIITQFPSQINIYTLLFLIICLPVICIFLLPSIFIFMSIFFIFLFFMIYPFIFYISFTILDFIFIFFKMFDFVCIFLILYYLLILDILY